MCPITPERLAELKEKANHENLDFAELTELFEYIEHLKLFECQNMGGYLLWDDKKWYASHLLSKREQEAKEDKEKLIQVIQLFGKRLIESGLKSPNTCKTPSTRP